MDYTYILLIVVVILIIFGIILYFFPRASKKIKSAPNPEKAPVKKPQEIVPPSREKPPEILPLPSELIALKGELMTMSSHTERIYLSNLEIARRDFSKRGIQNPSETDLHKRAIEIWRRDHR